MSINYFINNAKQKYEYNKKLISYIERVAKNTFDDAIIKSYNDQDESINNQKYFIYSNVVIMFS